jgi:putative copper resistance protein D
MHTLYTLSVFVHIAAACAWIGSMIFFAAAVVPVVRRPEYRGMYAELVRRIGARYRALGWTCIVVLVATGVSNLILRGIGVTQLSSGAFWSTDVGRALGGKLVAVFLVVLATAAHDILFGAKAMRRVEQDPASPQAQRSRRLASWLGRLTLLLSLVVLLLAVWMVRGLPG